jgi:hypothetical protein
VAAVQAELPHRRSIEIRSWARRHGITFHARLIRPDIADEVEALYRSGGYPAVRARFPQVTDRAVYSWMHRRDINPPKRARQPRKRTPRAEKPTWALPAQDVLQQLECVRFRKWRGPVNAGPLVATIGRAA